MVSEIVLSGGTVTAGVPKPGLAYLYPDGATGAAVVDWGDGAPTETLVFDSTNSPITVSHEWGSSRGQPGGAWQMSVTVDGNTTTQAVPVR